MSDNKKLTFCLMDGPFESARALTGLRLIDISVRRGYDVTVFAYEGAVSLTFSKQTAHANSVHGTSLEEEDHPLTKDWVAAMMQTARDNGGSLTWINCGLCVDERGVHEAIEGCQRGAPKHLWEAAEASHGSLVIGVR
jgi:sulfur relay (sulfurtransferase) complex TusBCD TusD component (DsrE family)